MELIQIELRENRKYKYMFNSIQDGILLIQDLHIKFMNSLACHIFEG